jgi:hypothetical protein
MRADGVYEKKEKLENHSVLFRVIAFVNVPPLSLMALNIGIRVPVLFVHQVTAQ